MNSSNGGANNNSGVKNFALLSLLASMATTSYAFTSITPSSITSKTAALFPRDSNIVAPVITPIHRRSIGDSITKLYDSATPPTPPTPPSPKDDSDTPSETSDAPSAKKEQEPVEKDDPVQTPPPTPPAQDVAAEVEAALQQAKNALKKVSESDKAEEGKVDLGTLDPEGQAEFISRVKTGQLRASDVESTAKTLKTKQEEKLKLKFTADGATAAVGAGLFGAAAGLILDSQVFLSGGLPPEGLSFLEDVSPVVPPAVLGVSLGAAAFAAGSLENFPGPLVRTVFGEPVKAAGRSIAAVPDKIATAAKKSIDSAVDEAKAVPGKIKTKASETAQSAIDEVKATPGRVVEKTKEVVKETEEKIEQAVKDTVEEIKATPGRVAEGTKKAVEDTVEGTKKAVSDTVEETKKAVKEKVDEVVAVPKKVGDEISGAVSKILPAGTETSTTKLPPPKVTPPKPAAPSPPPQVTKAAAASPKKPPSTPTPPQPPKFSPPKVSVPKISVPKVEVPKVSVPKVSVPKVSMPKIDIPSPPKAPPPQPTDKVTTPPKALPKEPKKKEEDNFVFSEVSLKEFINDSQKGKPSKEDITVSLQKAKDESSRAREAETKTREAEEKKAKVASEKKAEQALKKARPGQTISLFDIFGQTEKESSTSAAKSPTPPTTAAPRPMSAAPRGVPTISKWRQNSDGSVSGFISGSRNFKEGEAMTTSPIMGTVSGGMVVQTKSGSRYYLDEQTQEQADSAKGFFGLFRGGAATKKTEVALSAVQKAEAAQAKRREESEAKKAAIAKAEEKKAAMAAAAEAKKAAIAEAAEARRQEAEEKKAAAAAAAEEKKRAMTEAAEARRQEAEQKRAAMTDAAEAQRKATEEKKAALEEKRREAEQKKAASLAAAEAKKKEAEQKRATAASANQAEQVMKKAKPGATISLFGFGAPTQSTDEASPTPTPKPIRPSVAPRQVSAAPRGVPTISRWRQNRDGSIAGFISGSPNFKDGEAITTSPITSEGVGGAVVQTSSGSRYFLEEQSAEDAKSASGLFGLFGGGARTSAGVKATEPVTSVQKGADAAKARRKEAEAKKAAMAEAAEARRREAEERKAAAAAAAEAKKASMVEAAEARRQEAEERKAAMAEAAEARRQEAEEKKAAAAAAAEAKKAALAEAAEARRQEAEEKKAAAAATAEAKKAALAEAAEARRQEAEEKKAAAAKGKVNPPVSDKPKKPFSFGTFTLGSPPTSDKVPEEKTAAAPVSDKPKKPFSFGTFTLGSPPASDKAPAVAKPQQVSAAPRGVPTINRWKQNRDGSISGFISGSPNFREGEAVTTSPITSDPVGGAVVQTASGSRYFLAAKTVGRGATAAGAKSKEPVSSAQKVSKANQEAASRRAAMAEERKAAAEQKRQEVEAKRAAAAEALANKRQEAEEKRKAIAAAADEKRRQAQELRDRAKEASAKKAAAAAAEKAMKQAKPRASISLFGGGADAAAEKERKKRAAEAEKAMKQAKPRASISIFGFGADASGEEERKKRAAEAEKAMKQAKPRASISLFGGTSKVEPGEAIAPRGVPTIVRWRKRGDGGISGKIYGSPNFRDGEQVETSPIVSGSIGNNSLVKTGSGSSYFLSQTLPQGNAQNKRAAENAARTARSGATINLPSKKEAPQAAKKTLNISRSTPTVPIKSQPSSSGTKRAPRGVPTLVSWRKNRDGSITGFISGSPNFSEGERITTSPIASGDISAGQVVRTGSGSSYFLI